MVNRIKALFIYAAARLGENSTYQGIGFIAGLFGSHYAQLDWGQCTAIGAIISAALKITLPDLFKQAPPQPTVRSTTMSFNFSSFMSTLNQMLPTIGQAVEIMHPGDDQEAAKITVGTALIQAFINTMAQQNSAATPPAAPVQE